MKKFLLLLFTLSVLTFAQDSLKYKIGQMIMVGFNQTSESYDTLLQDIEYNNLGGVVLLAYNIENPEAVTALNEEIQSYAETPLLIAIDQEGGVVARMDENNGWVETPTAYSLGSIFDMEDSTRAVAARMAGWLTEAGFNFNLAPVVDVNVNPSSPAIGRYGRSFSDDPEVIVEHAGYFIDEFKKQNIVTALKHFPGHGSAMSDSHNGFTDITNTWSNEELRPYELLFEGGYTDFVMTGHLFNQQIDSTYPASISEKAIKGLLKDTLGFKGLVISDEMSMGAISNNYGFEEALKLAVNAGTDIILYKTNVDEDGSMVRKIIDIIYNAVQNNEIDESVINFAYNNIMSIKEGLVVSDVEDAADVIVPEIYQIANYPNPFNPVTSIKVEIPVEGNYSIAVYSTLGERVTVLQSGLLEQGAHQFRFDASGMASGMYIVTLSGNNVMKSHKMMLLK